MFSHVIKAAGPLATAALPLLGAPALAAGPETSSVVAMLGLSGQQISPRELGNIRGGFDLSPSLSISFAFKQVEAINGIIIQSIVVPVTTVTDLSADTNTVSSSVTSSGSPSVSSATSAVTPTTSTTSSPSVTVTNAAGSTQTVTPSGSNTINLTTVANNGLTVINTQLGSNGLSDVTTNQANNTAVSVSSTMDFAIGGLSQFLTQQESFANIQSGLYTTGSGFK
jgi:hypothetical protein